MLFRNPWLLWGLLGVLIPVILHLIRKQAAKPYDWGAMRFLFDTVAARRKRMEWEDFLLMVARCLLVALLALALARPFVPPDSQVPWLVVLPLVLLGVVLLGGSFVLSAKKMRWGMRVGAILLAGLAGLAIWNEREWNLQRFQTSERRDVVLIFDGSSSMQIRVGGVSLFERAVEEAKEFVREAPRGTSFSVVLGGPTPELKTATPLTHRADVLEVLEGLEPVGGGFRAYEALGVATLSLAEGSGSEQDLMVFTDRQRLGWQFESTVSWKNLGEAWSGMPSKPRLLVKTYDPPTEFRNLAVTGIELSREVVGVDREVVIRVGVENTGTEMVTPGLLRVWIGKEELEAKGMGQMAAGERATLEYRYQFKKMGPQVIRAELEGEDEMKEDHRAERVVWVKEVLPVLLVEGNAGGEFFDRGAGYLSLALAPLMTEGEKFVEPRVIEAAGLTREDFADEAVVILADVPRLPSVVAARLAKFVLEGGGLWVVAGPRVEEEFYGAWRGGDGFLMPMKVGGLVVPEGGVSPAVGSFDHATLRLFREAAGEDLGNAMVRGYRATSELIEGGQIGARYQDGEVFLATRDFGRGRVVLTTTTMDGRLSGLPARPSFVPLVHEVVNWLAVGQEVDLNVVASWSPTVELPGGGGLIGDYRDDGRRGRGRSFRRVDANIDFDWGARSPGRELRNDEFEVIWSGVLLPPLSGEYRFEAEADDRLQVSVGGEEVLDVSAGGQGKSFGLVAGEPVSFGAKYREDYGEAKVRLFWERPDGLRELVPSSVFVPIEKEGSRALLGEGKARDPRGREREVKAWLGRRGKILEVAGSALPGEYLVNVPGEIRDDLDGLEELPVVVLRDGRESRREVWNDDDRALMRREVDLIEFSKMADVLAVLRGEGIGREIWKILAIAALVLLFLESLLARWVSKSRRAGEEVRVDFERRDEVPSEFLKSVAEMKGGTR